MATEKVGEGVFNSERVNALSVPLLPVAKKQQRHGYWQRLKTRLLRTFLPAGDNTQLTAFLLGLFLGLFGVHRFYLKYNGEGIAYLCTSLFALLFILFGLLTFIFLPPLGALVVGTGLFMLSGLGIWLIVDLIRIAAGTLTPRND